MCPRKTLQKQQGLNKVLKMKEGERKAFESYHEYAKSHKQKVFSWENE